MKTVIFVHGFGVMKDARGMFTDIASVLTESGINCVLVDLNTKDKAGNILLSTLERQVKILIETYEKNKSEETYLIAHSQGCIVTALADLPNIKQTIFLAPPTDNNAEKTIAYFKKNPHTQINLSGTSRLARRDGTFTLVPKEYWEERESLDIPAIYKNFTTRHKTVVIKATQDEVVSNEAFSEIFKEVKTTEIEAGHDFTDGARDSLKSVCSRLII